MRPAWHARISEVCWHGHRELWPRAWTPNLDSAPDSDPYAHCRHADEVLSKTEQHIKQIKDLPPEVKETVQREGFQDAHAPRQLAQRAEE